MWGIRGKNLPKFKPFVALTTKTMIQNNFNKIKPQYFAAFLTARKFKHGVTFK